MEILESDTDAEPAVIHVRIWEDVPTEDNMRWACDRLRADDQRRIFFYSRSQDRADKPVAEWLIDTNNTERVQ